MTPDEFWLAINEARNHATTDTKIPSLLEAQLAKESLAHIVSFEEQLHARFNEAYDAKLWVAAGVILGNCSDDSFTDFRGWLIAQGRDVFLAAVRYRTRSRTSSVSLVTMALQDYFIFVTRQLVFTAKSSAINLLIFQFLISDRSCAIQKFATGMTSRFRGHFRGYRHDSVV